MTGRPLPNADRAIVPERKVTGYLLSETHPDGRGKARFFSAYGFAVPEWQSSAAALRRHGAEHPVADEVDTVFGTRYVVDGIYTQYSGRSDAAGPCRVVHRPRRRSAQAGHGLSRQAEAGT